MDISSPGHNQGNKQLIDNYLRMHIVRNVVLAHHARSREPDICIFKCTTQELCHTLRVFAIALYVNTEDQVMLLQFT